MFGRFWGGLGEIFVNMLSGFSEGFCKFLGGFRKEKQ